MTTAVDAKPWMPLCPEFAALDLAFKAMRATSHRFDEIVIPRSLCTLVDPGANRWRVELIARHKGRLVQSVTFLADLIDEAGDQTQWKAENVVLLDERGEPCRFFHPV